MHIQIPNVEPREAIAVLSRIVAAVPMSENDRLNAWGCQESLSNALGRLEQLEKKASEGAKASASPVPAKTAKQ